MSIFALLKSKISLVDVVSGYTTLKKAGLYWKGRCPFHHEKTASFTVSPHIDIFYCFGCHQTGDVISFVAKIEHCSQIEAAHYLAERNGIELQSDQFAKPSVQFDQKMRYSTICQEFALWCHGQLLKNAPVLNYLYKRGFTKEVLDYSLVGYLPGGLVSIKQLLFDMQKKSILAQDFIEAHILAEGKTVLYSPFEDRIIFPIKDPLEKFCGFGGRTFKEHDSRPKYYNSRESAFFSKGSLLFGLDQAKKTIQETGNVFLVEGYTDYLAMVQSGYSNTVATLGTACTSNHLKLLSRYATTLSVLYDSDNAGNQAVLRLTQMCWQANMDPRVITLPEGQDPASFLAQKQNLKPFIDGAQDIFVFFIKSLGENFSTKSLHQKMSIIRTLLEPIKHLDDTLKQDILLQKASEYLQVPVTVLKSEMGRVSKFADEHVDQIVDTNDRPQVSAKHELQEAPKLSRLEKKIFCAIMQNIQLFNKKEVVAIIDYLPSILRILLLKLKNTGDLEGDSVNFVTFFESLSEQQKKYVSSLLLEDEDPIDEESFDELIVQLRKKWWKTITRTVQTLVEQAKKEGNEKKVQELLSNFVTLQQKMVRSVAHNTLHDDNN